MNTMTAHAKDFECNVSHARFLMLLACWRAVTCQGKELQLNDQWLFELTKFDIDIEEL
jgi:hypothetical protein